MNHALRRQRGFTLMEVMIVVTILAILGAISYPLYAQQVAKGRRAQAQSVLLMAQQWMERFYTENFRYDQNSAGTKVTDASQFKARFSTSPPTGEGAAMYTIDLTIPEGSQSSYLITATRKSGVSMAKDKCGDFTVDHLGRKSIADGTWDAKAFASKAAAIAECWR